MSAFFWRVLILSLTAAALPLLAACGDDDDAGGGLNIVASLPLFADIAQNVAGERAAVDSLLPAGADPHTYEPSPGDVRKVADADVIFANGLNLEPAALRVIEANKADDAVFVELAPAALEAGTAVIPSEDEDDPEGNPHLWLDPAIGITYATIIRDALVAADADGAAVYNANFQRYTALITETQTYVLATVGVVPEDDRLLVTTHDAFDYLARAIGFEVAGFVAPSPGQEPSPQDIADLIATIQDFGIPAVFSEPQTDEEARTLEQIADEAGVEVCTLYSDAFDEDVTNYVDLLRFDAEEIARCLGGAGG
jgi:ABC-type Zn uptake system ZnuABC Zn-binding protein ZnuA